MRIGTSHFNNLMLRAMQNSMQSLSRTTDQLATGKRILQPSDDAVDTVKLLHLENELTAIKQYQDNIDSGRALLQQQNVLYSSMNDLMLRARDIMLQAGNDTLSQSNRNALAHELDSINQSLLALANDQMADGQYRFSGTTSNQKPVSLSGTDYVYNGNSNQRVINISGSAQIPVIQSGDALFFDSSSPAGYDSIFDALDAAADGLRNPTALSTTVANTLSWIDNTVSMIGDAQSRAGSNLATLDRVEESHKDIKLMASQLHSGLEDVDMISATTQLNQQQVVLSATQQVYSSITKLSLFNYL